MIFGLKINVLLTVYMILLSQKVRPSNAMEVTKLTAISPIVNKTRLISNSFL